MKMADSNINPGWYSAIILGKQYSECIDLGNVYLSQGYPILSPNNGNSYYFLNTPMKFELLGGDSAIGEQL